MYLSALDDPLTPQDIIPQAEIKANPFTMLATLPFGSHGCFKTGIQPKSVMGEIAKDYFNSVAATFPIQQKTTAIHEIEPHDIKLSM